MDWLKALYFLIPSSRTSRKMSRSPRLANKAPVTQVSCCLEVNS